MAYQLALLSGDPAAACDPGLVAGANRGRQIAAVELIAAALTRDQLALLPGDPAAACDPGLVAGANRGRQIAAVELIAAALTRADLHHRMARFFASYDLLLTPTLPLAAFEVPHLLPPTGTWGEDWTDWAPFSYPFNSTQQPAASLPCGFTGHGLPVGLQVVAGIGRD